MDEETQLQNTRQQPVRIKFGADKKNGNEKEEKEEKGLSPTGWWLLIGALAVIDAVQIFLDLFVIGVVINRGIDIVVGMALPLFLVLNGETIVEPKRMFALLGAFGLEMIPVADAMPWWTADGIYYRYLSKLEKKIPIAKAIKKYDKFNLIKSRAYKDLAKREVKTEAIDLLKKKDIKKNLAPTQKESTMPTNVSTPENYEAQSNKLNNSNDNEKENNEDRDENDNVISIDWKKKKKNPPKVMDFSEEKRKIEDLKNDLARLEKQREIARTDLWEEKDKLEGIGANELSDQSKKVSKMIIESNINLIYSLDVRINTLSTEIGNKKMDMMEIEQENYRNSGAAR